LLNLINNKGMVFQSAQKKPLEEVTPEYRKTILRMQEDPEFENHERARKRRNQQMYRARKTGIIPTEGTSYFYLLTNSGWVF
jgi:hypothetical protein